MKDKEWRKLLEKNFTEEVKFEVTYDMTSTIKTLEETSQTLEGACT